MLWSILHLSYRSEPVLRLDYRILLKSPPPNLTGWIRPWFMTIGKKKHHRCFNVMILKTSKILVAIRFHRIAKCQCIFCHQMQKLCRDYFANCIHCCSHITLSFSSNVNIVECLVSVPAVRLFIGSVLTISFGLACRNYTFNRSAFNVVFQNV